MKIMLLIVSLFLIETAAQVNVCVYVCVCVCEECLWFLQNVHYYNL